MNVIEKQETKLGKDVQCICDNIAFGN